jgi:glycerol-3-phosphate acyltransferase PlsY
MGPWWQFSLIWLGAYLVGAIPFGYLVAKARGVDIFAQGSGNIGATNVGRVLGRRFGILVFLLDFAKGAVPVILASWWNAWMETPEQGDLPPGLLEVGTGLAAFLGHLFPVYLGFRGGKGVATGAGAVAVLLPGPGLAALATWLVVVAATRYVSLASVVAALVLCALQLGWSGSSWTEPRNLFSLVAAGLILVRHRSNLVRLWQGKENRLKESPAMHQLAKTLHLLALGMWFGTCVFFTFFVALSLFHSFETLGQSEERPSWFPRSETFANVTPLINGPKEQGARAAGFAVGPLFHWYFLIQGVCGLVALFLAVSWSRRHPQKVHRWRVGLLLTALILVLVGWPLEPKVSALREPRNQATEAYLQQENPGSDAKVLEAMQSARKEFGLWHTFSLLVNLVVVVLVTGAMILAARLPEDPVFPGAENEEKPQRNVVEGG